MLKGFLFGLTVAAAVGPIALLIVNTSLRFGLSAGARAGLGAAMADLAYAVAAAFAGAALAQAVRAHETAISVVASGVLIAMGAYLVWGALRPAGARTQHTPQAERPFAFTFALTIINPLTLIAFAAFIAQTPSAADPLEAALVAIGIFLGSLVVQLILAAGGAGLRRIISGDGVMRALNVLSGLGIAAFGVWGLVAR